MDREIAPAKVNLFLHVGPPYEDGRHPLDSLTVFADDSAADILEVEPADRISLVVDGQFADQAGDVDQNLVLRAARALADQAGVDQGAALRLDKRLPVAAGIGGGSADAGAALRLLSRLWGVDDADLCRTIAGGLGGDVPAAYLSRPLLMRGWGERTLPLHLPQSVPAVLANSGIACPTGPVFRHFDEQGGGGGFEEHDPPEIVALADTLTWLQRCRNDLEPPAIALAGEISDLLDTLEALPDAKLARMSGSGSTCFAVFETMDAAHAAAYKLRAQNPEWWIAATELGPAGE